MTDSGSKRDWASIDADSDAEEFVEALDEEAAREDYLEVKLERHELMGVAEGDNVLDVGCGQGIDVRLLSSRVGAEGSVLGIDASETMLEAARERTEVTDNVRFERGDALDLGFADDRFDAVQAERVLCHLETPTRALSEFVRVTRPGGRVGISEVDMGSHIMDTPTGHSVEDLDPEYAIHEHPLIGRRMYRLMNEAGLVDVDVSLAAFHDLSFDFLQRVIPYDDWLDAMVAADEISRSEADAWLEAVQTASDEGRFFNGGMGITVVGTVPETQ